MNQASKNKSRNGVVKKGNKWYYYLRIPDENDPLNKKTKLLWFSGFQSKKDAEEARARKKIEIKEGNYVSRQNITLKEYLEMWLHQHKVSGNIRDNTFEKYEYKINKHISSKIGHFELQKIKTKDINKFYQVLLTSPSAKTKGLSTRSVQDIHAILSRAFKDAIRNGYLVFNPITNANKPKSKKVKIWTEWSKQDFIKYLETISGHRLSIAFRLLAFTGARRGEIIGIRWSDLNFKIDAKQNESVEDFLLTIKSSVKKLKGGVVSIDYPKNDDPRTINLDEETVKQLRIHRKRQIQERLKMGSLWNDNDLIISTNIGEFVYPDTLTKLHEEFVKKAGIPKNRLHDLRHNHASTLLDAGVPLHEVAARLGHRDSTTTAKIYSHILNNGQSRNLAKIFVESTKITS